MLQPQEFWTPDTLKTTIKTLDYSAIAWVVHQKITALLPTFQQELKASHGTEELLNKTYSYDDNVQIQFFFNVVNFAYWAPQGVEKWAFSGTGEDGSYGLYHAFEQQKAHLDSWDATRMANLTIHEFDTLLGTDLSIPMREERLSMLQSAGKDLLRCTSSGRASELIEQADHSATRLVQILCEEFSSYQDLSTWQGNDHLPFMKRAQLFIKVVNDAGILAGKDPLQHLDALTAFSDYKVPQVLFDLGLIQYAPSLRAQLDSWTELNKNSDEEVAIRMVTIEAVEAIRTALSKIGIETNAAEIDSILWRLGTKKKEGSAPSLYHRTRTSAY